MVCTTLSRRGEVMSPILETESIESISARLDKEIHRCVYSRLRWFWRLRYGVPPWKREAEIWPWRKKP